MQVEDPRGKACDQDVCGLVEGSSSQAVKVTFLVEEVSAGAKANQINTYMNKTAAEVSVGPPQISVSH